MSLPVAATADFVFHGQASAISECLSPDGTRPWTFVQFTILDTIVGSGTRSTGHQSYQVYDDEVLLAITGDDCDDWLGMGATRPDPAVDVLAVAQGLGEAYGDCPSPWTSPPVAPPGPLALYNGTYLNVEFTLNNLGDGTEDVTWQVLFTDDLTDTDCSTSGYWVAYEDTSSIGANTRGNTSRSPSLFPWMRRSATTTCKS